MASFIWANIGLVNGLVHDDTKLWPEPVLRSYELHPNGTHIGEIWNKMVEMWNYLRSRAPVLNVQITSARKPPNSNTCIHAYVPWSMLICWWPVLTSTHSVYLMLPPLPGTWWTSCRSIQEHLSSTIYKLFSSKPCENNLFASVGSDAIRPQICTCHDSWAVVACAKLWPEWIIIFDVRST